MSAENVKVCIRFRNKKAGNDVAVKFDDECQVTVRSTVMKERGQPKYTKRYDRCWQGDSTQEEVYNVIGRPLLGNIFEGYNSTLFVYGQTGSGKTYTMFGPDGGKMHENPGVVPRLMNEMFAGIAQREKARPDTKYTVTTSIVDIYLEKCRDLLNKEVLVKNSSANNLKVRCDKKIGVYITYPDARDHLATEIEVTDCDQTLGVVNSAIKLRAKTGAQAKTNMNAYSSRSHLVIIVNLKEESPAGIKTSKLLLCDLAGSEKVRNTGAVGIQLKQAQNINYGLSVLGNVLNCLTDKKRQTRNMVVPFRDSKLTAILQDSLGGNCKTALICACRPDDGYYAETISTLRFGFNAKSIQNKVVKNETLTVAQYKKRMKLYESRIHDFEATLAITEKKYEAQTHWSKVLEQDLEERGVDIQTFAKKHNLMSTAEIEQEFAKERESLLDSSSSAMGLGTIFEGQMPTGGSHATSHSMFTGQAYPSNAEASAVSRRHNAELMKQLEDAREDIHSTRIQLRASNDYIGQLEGENFDYRDMVSEMHSKEHVLKQLKGDNFRYKSELDELRKKVTYLDNHNRELENRENRGAECIDLIKNVRVSSLATSMSKSQRELKRIQKAIENGQSEEIVEIVSNLVQQGQEIEKLKQALAASQEQNRAMRTLQERERQTRSQNQKEILNVWAKYQLEKAKWHEEQTLMSYKIGAQEEQIEELRAARDQAQKQLRASEGASGSSSDIKKALASNPASFFKFLRATNVEKRLSGKAGRRAPKRRKRRPELDSDLGRLSLTDIDTTPGMESSGMTSPVA